MKILLYNYVTPNEIKASGGGVTIYLDNLSRELKGRGHDVLFLSAGDRYDLTIRHPHVHFNASLDEATICNSPNFAPAARSFHYPEIYSNSARLNDVPLQLKQRFGDIDIFHFHNIEGLTKGFFLSLRNMFPTSGLVYSAHNYHSVCYQVNLWQHGTRHCTDFMDGFACIDCAQRKHRSHAKNLAAKVAATQVKRLLDSAPQLLKVVNSTQSLVRKLGSQDSAATEPRPIVVSRNTRARIEKARAYVEFRSDNIFLINEVFDKTIAVSQRTMDILVSYGACPDSLTISYIGTKHYEKFASSVKKSPTPDNIHIGYLGYMTRQKGFFFFLDILDSLPENVLANIDVTVAARFNDSKGISRLNAIERKVRSLRKYDGYSHGDIATILQSVNIGVIPSLWEDNLPQIAIEFVTNGVPILTSDLGGASEIAGDPNFIFTSKDAREAALKIMSIANGSLDMSQFWKNTLRLKSVPGHVREIIDIYHLILSKRRGSLT